MSRDMAWVCTVGGHWACHKCTNGHICRIHANSRIVNVGPLWYKTVSYGSRYTEICSLGCVGVLGGVEHRCERRNTGPISLGRHGPQNGLTMFKRTVSKLRGCTTTDSGAIMPARAPFMAEIHHISKGTIKCTLHCPLYNGHLKCCIIGGSAHVVTITLHPSSPPRLKQFFSLVWPLVSIRVA